MAMETFPILETDRLRLRQLTVGDAEDVFGYFSKDEVTQYYDLESFTEVEQAEKFIRSMLTRYEKQEGFRWGITLKKLLSGSWVQLDFITGRRSTPVLKSAMSWHRNIGGRV